METKQMSRALMIVPPFAFNDIMSISTESIVDLATNIKGRSKNLNIPAIESGEEDWEKWEGEEKVAVNKKKKS